MAFDFGLKRTGVALTDSSQLIASPYSSISSLDIVPFLQRFLAKEKLECLVIGQPRFMDGTPMDLEHNILILIEHLNSKFPTLAIKRVDERFTSKMAGQTLHMLGASGKAKKDKGVIDEMSAALILQAYLDSRPSSD